MTDEVAKEMNRIMRLEAKAERLREEVDLALDAAKGHFEDAERLREERDYYHRRLGEVAFQRERLRDQRDEALGQLRDWKARAVPGRAERLRELHKQAQEGAAAYLRDAQRLREALERIANAHPDSNDARWAEEIARAALSQPVSNEEDE